MSATEATVVHATGVSSTDALVAITAATPDELVKAVQQYSEVSQLIVAIDEAVSGDRDALVAVVSVLTSLGVEHIETTEPRAVRRIFDTHRAISAGDIEVLEA